jgi:hypothetical protein
MFMMINQINNKFIKILQDYQYVVPYKDIMLQFLLMDKQEQEKLIQWKDLDIICMTTKEELYQEQYKIYLDIYNLVKIKT